MRKEPPEGLAGVCVLDAAWWPGHSASMVGGVLGALRSLGAEVGLAINEVTRDEMGRPATPWHPLARVPISNPLRRTRQLHGVGRFAAASGLDTLVDLYFDLHATGFTAARPGWFPSAVHVAHGDRWLDPGTGSSGRARRAMAGVALQRLRRRGRSVATHTAAGREAVLAAGGLAELVPLAVSVGDAPPPPPGDRRRTVLFIGDSRTDKGLAPLAEALVGLDVEVEVAGAIDAASEASLRRQVPGATVLGRLSRADLVGLYRTAGLVVLPYRSTHAAAGVASAVLLEALCSGCPVVVTPALAPQLPSPDAAVVAEGESPAALRAAVTAALDRLDALTAAATEQAPELGRRHSFATYTQRLLELAR